MHLGQIVFYTVLYVLVIKKNKAMLGTCAKRIYFLSLV